MKIVLQILNYFSSSLINAHQTVRYGQEKRKHSNTNNDKQNHKKNKVLFSQYSLSLINEMSQ